MDGFADRLQRLEGVVHALQQQNITVARRLRWWRRLACGLALLTVFGLPLSLDARSADRKGEDHNGVDHQLKSLLRRFLAIERKLEHVTSELNQAGLPEVVITGANLRIVNGLGATATTNGLGNLIVGYNEQFGPGNRTGSHNAVVGRSNNFSSFGGLVVGDFNEISGEFASVSGGVENVASGRWSSVSGGNRNMASNDFSSVSGGAVNTADGIGSSVSGGVANLAGGPLGFGPFSSVSVGESNTASGISSSVSGGAANAASGSGASISGGLFNTASETFSSVSGGANNIASGPHSSVSGGINRTAPGLDDWAAGGLFQDQ
jgi:hypothetical protein